MIRCEYITVATCRQNIQSKVVIISLIIFIVHTFFRQYFIVVGLEMDSKKIVCFLSSCCFLQPDINRCQQMVSFVKCGKRQPWLTFSHPQINVYRVLYWHANDTARTFICLLFANREKFHKCQPGQVGITQFSIINTIL